MNLQPPTAARTPQRIHHEHTPKKLRPGDPSRVHGRPTPSARAQPHTRRRTHRPSGHDLPTTPCRRREHPVIVNLVPPGLWDDRHQPAEQLVGSQQHAGGPIVPAPLELQEQPPIRPLCQPVVGQRRALYVPAQPLQRRWTMPSSSCLCSTPCWSVARCRMRPTPVLRSRLARSTSTR